MQDPLNPKAKMGFAATSPRFKSQDKAKEETAKIGPGSYDYFAAAEVSDKKKQLLKQDQRTGTFKSVDREKHFVNILQSKADPGGEKTGPGKYVGKGPFLKKSFNVSLPPQKFT